MFKAILVAALVAITALSGCTGEDGDEAPTETTSGTAGSTRAPNLTVTISNATSAANSAEPINVTWEVSLDSETNATDVEIEHTDIHWGNETIADPAVALYPNATEEQTGPPGVYNATFTIESNGTFYVRAHAIINGTDYWSDEILIQVSPGIPPLGQVHEVEVGALLPASLASFDPAALTIKVGDGVKWINRDRIASHTATSDEGAPQAFDTGSIATGAESAVIQFTIPGEYSYHCSVHPSMEAALTVEA